MHDNTATHVPARPQNKRMSKSAKESTELDPKRSRGVSRRALRFQQCDGMQTVEGKVSRECVDTNKDCFIAETQVNNKKKRGGVINSICLSVFIHIFKFAHFVPVFIFFNTKPSAGWFHLKMRQLDMRYSACAANFSRFVAATEHC